MRHERERSVDEASFALDADETFLMPVSVSHRHVLRGSNSRGNSNRAISSTLYMFKTVLVGLYTTPACAKSRSLIK